MPRESQLKPGYRINKITIIENLEVPRGRNGQGLWRVRCDCGNVKVLRGYSLNPSSNLQSCGCESAMSQAHGAVKRRGYGETTMNFEYSVYRRAATSRGHVPLSKPEWREMVLKPCAYCGGFDVRNYPVRRLKNKYLDMGEEEAEKYKVSMNAIDRVDSSLGYVQGNMVPCCGMCNVMKMAHSREDFLAKVKQIHDYCHLDLTESSVAPATPIECIPRVTTLPSQP